MDQSIFLICQEEFPGGNSTVLLECVAKALEAKDDAQSENLRSFLFVLAGALVFFMQAGFATLCAGAVRIKNVQNTMLKNLLDACGAALAFFLVGFAIAFGGQDEATGTTFLGTSDFVSAGPKASFWFFQYTFSATSVTIVAGTLAERCQMAAYLCYSILLAGFIYPIVAHAVWANTGFLSHVNSDPFLGVGAIDFAGSGVVHVTGGTIALYATILLGPRRGRFYDSQGEPLETPKPFPGHSMALQLLGTMILWFGWFGFNGGSALLLPEPTTIGQNAANAAVSTALSGAAGGISALFTNLVLEERRTGEPSFDLVMCMNGVLSGLVAVTAGCGVFEPWAAALSGIIAGWLYIFGDHTLIRLRIDDAVNAIPVHMINGLWGLLAVGFFASPRKMELAFGIETHAGLVYDFTDARLLGAQACTGLFICGWTFFTMFPFFFWLSYQGWLRADSLEELVGLDISYHGGMHSVGQSDEVKKEFIDAFSRNKSSTLRQRRGKGESSTANVESVGYMSEADMNDPDYNQEVAAAEALQEDSFRNNV